jgi:hypothetical protein
MAHCFDIHKSDRPCPHSPPEKQKHDAGIGKFVRVELRKNINMLLLKKYKVSLFLCDSSNT